MKNIKSFALVAALALGLSACGGDTEDSNGSADMGSATETTEAEDVKTGTATAEGYDGEMTVTVTMEGDEITNIERDSTETDNVGEVALDELTEKMIEENTADVEEVSGATVSSTAFKEAVQEAIDNAE